MNQSKLSMPYLLVLFSVPFMRNAQDQLCVSLAWAKDLIEHANYIENLTLIAYFSNETAPADVVVIEQHPALKNVRFVQMQKPNSTAHAIRLLPSTMSVLWREVDRNQIIHSSVASWPIPEAWLILPILWFKKRFHFINVESAFWRVPKGQTPSFKEKVRAKIWEYLNQKCVQSADLSTFTQEDYKKTLLKNLQHKGYVIPASWIDAEDILATSDLNALIAYKKKQLNTTIKLVFVGRLVHEKGIILLINAVSQLIDSGQSLSLDIYGDGNLKQACADLITSNKKTNFIHLCGLVKYGADFFKLLQRYDLMVIPSLSDEQPRNVFDAFSQALPVLSADTPGLRQCVSQQSTGWFFKVGDINDLKNHIISINNDRQALLNMSINCVYTAQNMTHKQMHMKRLGILQQSWTCYINQ